MTQFLTHTPVVNGPTFNDMADESRYGGQMSMPVQQGMMSAPYAYKQMPFYGLTQPTTPPRAGYYHHPMTPHTPSPAQFPITPALSHGPGPQMRQQSFPVTPVSPAPGQTGHQFTTAKSYVANVVGTSEQQQQGLVRSHDNSERSVPGLDKECEKCDALTKNHANAATFAPKQVVFAKQAGSGEYMPVYRKANSADPAKSKTTTKSSTSMPKHVNVNKVEKSQTPKQESKTPAWNGRRTRVGDAYLLACAAKEKAQRKPVSPVWMKFVREPKTPNLAAINSEENSKAIKQWQEQQAMYLTAQDHRVPFVVDDQLYLVCKATCTMHLFATRAYNAQAGRYHWLDLLGSSIGAEEQNGAAFKQCGKPIAGTLGSFGGFHLVQPVMQVPAPEPPLTFRQPTASTKPGPLKLGKDPCWNEEPGDVEADMLGC